MYHVIASSDARLEGFDEELCPSICVLKFENIRSVRNSKSDAMYPCSPGGPLAPASLSPEFIVWFEESEH